MACTYVFLADGFEEVEGLTVVDILRRSAEETKTVSVMGRKTITGSHGIELQADLLFDDIREEDEELLVLPGGMPGTNHLAEHEGLARLLKDQDAAGKKIAAICAAPTVLGGLGLLKGRTAVCYPGMEDQLTGAKIGTNPVEVSGNITTSRGVGTAIPFALSLVSQLKGQTLADQLAQSIVWKKAE